MVAWRYEISLLVLKKNVLPFFQHLKRNFVSPSDHVISSVTVLNIKMITETQKHRW